MRNDFITLRRAIIVGIVDHLGVVYSKASKYGEERAYHERDFKNAQVKWTWNFNDGIGWFSPENKPDSEQYDAIMRHITKTYGIKFWENGHHDLDYFEQKWSDQKKANKSKKSENNNKLKQKL